MLPQRHRLRRAADLASVRQKGRRWHHPLVVLLVYSSGNEASAACRFAFSVGRRVGHAVTRNRLRRRMREIVRARLPGIESGYDCLFIARPGAAQASYADLEDAMSQLLTSAGLLNYPKKSAPRA